MFGVKLGIGCIGVKYVSFRCVSGGCGSVECACMNQA